MFHCFQGIFHGSVSHWVRKPEMHEFCYFPAGLARGWMRKFLMISEKCEYCFKNVKECLLDLNIISRIQEMFHCFQEIFDGFRLALGPEAGRCMSFLIFRLVWERAECKYFLMISARLEDYFRNPEKYFSELKIISCISTNVSLFPRNISRIPSGAGPRSRKMHEFPNFRPVWERTGCE